MNITQLSSIDALNAFTADNERAMVVVSRNNCVACVAQKTAMENDVVLQETLKGSGYAIATLKLEDVPAVAGVLALRAAPTTLLFHGDDEVARIGGFSSAEHFIGRVKAADVVVED